MHNRAKCLCRVRSSAHRVTSVRGNRASLQNAGRSDRGDASAHGERSGRRERKKEAEAELEIGAAAEWAIPGGDTGFCASIGIEYTLIKEWLEVEVEVSPLFGAGRTDWDTELIFKKPYSLSDKIEVMPGIGPAWLYRTGREGNTHSFGAVALVDIQIWPTPERNFGWFIEPTYTYDFGREHEQSLGVTFGLLIPIR